MNSSRLALLYGTLTTVTVGLLLGLAACSTAPKSAGNSPNPTEKAPMANGNATGGGEDFGPAPPAAKPDEDYGPAGPSASSTSPPPGAAVNDVYGPAPVELHPVTLVLGPGMARAYADEGVLRTMVKRKVPIVSLYGMGLGSLVAAVYAADPNLNRFEWAMLKFKDELFQTREDGLRKFFSRDEEGSRLEAVLTQIFGDKDISSTKVPLHIAIQEKGSTLPTILTQGSLVQALRAALATPGVFKPVNREGRLAQAATSLSGVSFLCDDARAQGGKPVVLVDTIGVAEEVRNVDVLIKPGLDGMNDQDYRKKTDAAYKGSRAAETKLPEIRRWVGLPQSVSFNSTFNPRVAQK